MRFLTILGLLLILTPAMAVKRDYKDLDIREQKQMYKNCINDINAYCHHTSPGQNRIAFCLLKFNDSLEARCRADLEDYFEFIQGGDF